MSGECRVRLDNELLSGPVECVKNDGHDGDHFAPMGGVRWAPQSAAEPLSDANPQPRTHDGGPPATEALSGPHGVVQAILAVTPLDEDGEAVVGYGRQFEVQFPQWADPRPIAAKQATAVLRWLQNQAAEGLALWHWLAALADEVEAAGTDNTTRRDAP